MKKELTKKNIEDMMKELDQKRLALRDLRFGIAGSKNKNVKAQRNLRRDIARIMTELRITS